MRSPRKYTWHTARLTKLRELADQCVPRDVIAVMMGMRLDVLCNYAMRHGVLLPYASKRREDWLPGVFPWKRII